MSRFVKIYQLYSVAAILSMFLILLFNWMLEFSQLSNATAWCAWEPNPIIHTYEAIMMIVAVPGLVWTLFTALASDDHKSEHEAEWY
jgi:hypothetical protein